MLDIKFIRDSQKLVRDNCKKRGVKVDVDRLLALDLEIREVHRRTDKLRAERNKVSKGKPTAKEITRMRAVGEEIKELETKLKYLEDECQALLCQLPNLIHESVPFGPDESGNRVVRQWGKPAKFKFIPKEHWELGEALGLIDFEHAAKISGARFAYLKGDLALLEFGLIQHALSVVTNKKTLQLIAKKNKLPVSTKPFIPVVPPVLMRPDIMHKMGRLEPREERYHIPSDDLYLVGSAEHTLGPLHLEEVIPEAELPIRYVGFSTAFRREAGSYGKDTKGILRVHQFDKLEFESFTTPENGLSEQDFIIALQESLMQSLCIPYQVVLKCTGDMGAPDYREYDIEAWLPGQNKYRETHTSDYMTDYQARRLQTRVKRANGAVELAHMNDATVFAVGRTLIAIMENYQQADGSIGVPKILQKHLGKKVIGAAK